jgi:hypothetical protein
MNRKTRYTYVGRRVLSGGVLAYAYQDANEPADLHVFKKPLRSGIQVGTILDVVEDGRSVITAGEDAPQVAGTNADHRVTEGWAGESAAAEVLHARTALDRRKAREVPDPLGEAFEALQRAYSACRGHGQRAAFIDYVNARIQGVR